MKYTFWNNKGGTGKTSLAFQTITEYAIKNPNNKILAIDLCPQANLSELFMGGLLNNGGNNLNNLYKSFQQKALLIGNHTHIHLLLGFVIFLVQCFFVILQ